MTHHDPIVFEGRDGIRCVQQLGMVKLWEHLRRDSELPQASQVKGHDVERVRDKLMVVDVVWDDVGPRCLIRFQGADYRKMHRDSTGLYLHDAIAPVVRENGLPIYRAVIEGRRPGFNVTQICDGDAVVSFERLLLPFTYTGHTVDQIYCIVTLFTEDNRSPFETMRNAVARAGEDTSQRVWKSRASG